MNLNCDLCKIPVDILGKDYFNERSVTRCRQCGRIAIATINTDGFDNPRHEFPAAGARDYRQELLDFCGLLIAEEKEADLCHGPKVQERSYHPTTTNVPNAEWHRGICAEIGVLADLAREKIKSLEAPDETE